jgi:uncharacterized protein YciI
MKMYFAVLCFDQPGVGRLRENLRASHLAYLKEHAALTHLGGPFESDEGGIVGTFFIINVEDRAAALRFTQNEPFHKGGVFESVLVRRWRQMQPEISPGANEGSAKEAELQLREEGQEVH